MDVRQTTLDAARRALRCRLQLEVCRRGRKEGLDASIWEPLEWLAGGFASDTNKDWLQVLDEHWPAPLAIEIRENLKGVVIEALAMAVEEACDPYKDKADPKWLSAIASEWVKEFRFEDLIPEDRR